MTILDPSARRWDVTPKRRIVTTRHRLVFDPGFGARIAAAQTVQNAVYDTTLEHLDRHGPMPWQVPADGPDSVLKWLTRERRRHPGWSAVALVVARGAAQQAWLAWTRWDVAKQALAEQWLAEHAHEEAIRSGKGPHPNTIECPVERAQHEPSARLMRRLTNEPGRCTRRQSNHAAVRLAAPCTRGAKPGAWHVPGVGPVQVHPGDTIPDDANVRSVQLVERTRPGTPPEKRRYVLHIQSGHPIPESLDIGTAVGLDYGIRHAVTTSDGRHLDRPDTGPLETQAKALHTRAKTRCRKGSRQYRKLRAAAGRLRQHAAKLQDRFERQTAVDVVHGASLLAREDLKLPNMTAAGTGTPSAPGSGAKRGLNRELSRARLGKLDARIVRRCLKTGTQTVSVHPGNTSTTCNRCGVKDPKSRSGSSFECTACDHLEDADANAARNIRDRDDHVFTAWKARQGRRRPSSRTEPKRTARVG